MYLKSNRINQPPSFGPGPSRKAAKPSYDRILNAINDGARDIAINHDISRLARKPQVARFLRKRRGASARSRS